ncbi:MAG TPA: hypothetical protein HPQ03_00680 [Deltaproteobacteria bacterium]|nr:hypothetical protein [Deltaproteobacteria bacterium]
MVEEKVKPKGSFRSTLALLVSIIALILSIVAYNRTGGDSDLKAEITKLQTRIKEMKNETSDQVKRLREETGKTIEKLGKAIKKEEEPSQ